MMRREELLHRLRAAIPRSLTAPLLPVALAVALAAGAASAPAQMEADAVFRGFQPTGDFLFELGGADLKNAEIYVSERAAAYLVIAPELASPVLISPRTRSVESVSFMKVAKREDGSIDLLADAAFDRLGDFRIEGQNVVFDVKGQEARLKTKPPLLGVQEPATLRSEKPEYALAADSYEPIPRALEILKAQTKDVRVLVYFGTWCPVCGRLVPKILKVDEALAGSNKVRFEYYGLPQPLTDDPRAKRDGVHGVPTGIVYVDGKEVGRLSGGDLNVPETAIGRLLEKS